MRKKLSWIYVITFFLMSASLIAQGPMGSQSNDDAGFRGNGRGKGFRGEMRGKGGKQPREMFAKLNLTEDQKEKLKTIQKDHRNKMHKIHSQKRDLNFEIANLLTAKELNSAEVDKKIADLNKNHSEGLSERIELVKKIRGILTEKQISELNFEMLWGDRGRVRGMGRDF